MIAKRRMELMRITLEIIYEVVGFGRHKIRMVVKINSIKIVTHISKDNEEYIELTFPGDIYQKQKANISTGSEFRKCRGVLLIERSILYGKIGDCYILQGR